MAADRQNNVVGSPFRQTPHTLHQHLDFTSLEQYKLLRANLSFTMPEDEKCPVIGITSSTRGEGKSTTAVNLSYVLAESGKKVLLIDADLRLPSVAKKMGIRNTPGLSNVLMSPDKLSFDSYRSTVSGNWYIVPSGDLPPNPSELLSSRKMEKLLLAAKEVFDVIVLDLPPVNIVSDAIAISRKITGMILVIREDFTEKRELNECVRQLKLSEVKVLGCLMNGCKSTAGSFKKYRYNRRYRYKQYGNPGEETK